MSANGSKGTGVASSLSSTQTSAPTGSTTYSDMFKDNNSPMPSTPAAGGKSASGGIAPTGTGNTTSTGIGGVSTYIPTVAPLVPSTSAAPAVNSCDRSINHR